MILLIDNYDSFSYNLVQYIGSIEPDIRVIRNDQYTVREIEQMQPQAIVISPGPGRPKDAGICIEAIRYFKDKVPILGVCLGHQAICEAFGGVVSYAKELMHGKTSMAELSPDSPLFQGLESPIQVARYHSLAALEESLPPDLLVTARTPDKEIMAVQHRDYPVFGLQFHPESVLTPDGLKIIANFIHMCNYDYSVKSSNPRYACIPVGERLYDAPQHEEEVGRGSHGFRMLGRIVEAAKQRNNP